MDRYNADGTRADVGSFEPTVKNTPRANAFGFHALASSAIFHELERELAAMTAERDGYAQQVQRLTDELRQATRGAQ